MVRAAATGTRTFAVTPPSTRAWLALVLVGGVLPLLGLALVAWLEPTARTGMRHAWPVLVLLPALLALLIAAMRRRSVALADGMLDVRAGLHRKRVPLASIDLGRARVVDLDEMTALRPLLKTGGMSVPGFQAGHFRVRERLGKAFCLLTDRNRVLWLPLRDGKGHLLLSLESPQALIDALGAASHSRRTGP